MNRDLRRGQTQAPDSRGPCLQVLSGLGHTHGAGAASNTTVLVPSQDGGTNLIASEGPFPFAYGPGSFHRHFASVPRATIISTAELSIDIDSPTQLAAFPELSRASSLSP